MTNKLSKLSGSVFYFDGYQGDAYLITSSLVRSDGLIPSIIVNASCHDILVTNCNELRYFSEEELQHSDYKLTSINNIPPLIWQSIEAKLQQAYDSGDHIISPRKRDVDTSPVEIDTVCVFEWHTKYITVSIFHAPAPPAGWEVHLGAYKTNFGYERRGYGNTSHLIFKNNLLPKETIGRTTFGVGFANHDMREAYAMLHRLINDYGKKDSRRI